MGRRRISGGLAMSIVAVTLLGCVPEVPLTRFPTAPDPMVVTPSPPDTAGPLRMRGGDLVDAHGRVVLLHGINSVNKSAPFISLLSDGSLGPADRAYLVGNGLNAVRLGVSYAALMPTPGDIDETYLDSVVAVVDALSADGLWVQLDFHQDVFHMMPEWATPPDALTMSDDAPEFLSFIGWAAAYTSPRSIRQWDAFLSGERFVDGRSVAAWLGDAAAALADRVTDRDHVIGIELLNEPSSGSAVVRCILDGCGDVEGQLADRYADMTTAIRAVAPDMPIWEEPFAPTALAAPGGLPKRSVPSTSNGAQVGLSWHLYCFDTDGGKVEDAPPAMAAFCQQRFRTGFDVGTSMAAVLDAPRLLNEFGASQNPLDATLVTRLADEQFVSWMYWHHKAGVTGLDSPLPDEVETQIVRAYPQATAGTPRQLSFDPVTGAFAYRFTPDATIDAPTSIAVPGRAYPAGYRVEVANGAVTSPPQSGRLTVVPDASGLDVVVKVTRA